MNSNLISKKNIIICLIGIAVIVGLIYTVKDNRPNNISEYDKEARIVKNFNDFYTINNCINKFVSYVNNKNHEAILSVLSTNYKEKNNINTNNLLSTLNLEENSLFVAKKMLYKYVDDKEYKYYVYGLQGKNNITMDSDFDETKAHDAYYIVYLKESEDEKLFSIEPYDGKEFINGVE